MPKLYSDIAVSTARMGVGRTRRARALVEFRATSGVVRMTPEEALQFAADIVRVSENAAAEEIGT